MPCPIRTVWLAMGQSSCNLHQSHGTSQCQGRGGRQIPLALPGDDVTPQKFVSFWCDGGRGLYLHPNVWHGAVVPLDDEAEFLDRQGRVHARVSVDFAKEFGVYLSAPLRRPA